jgi:hypothetical protein
LNRASRNLAVFLVLFSHSTFAKIVDLDLRHQLSRAMPNTLQQSAALSETYENSGWLVGARLWEDSLSLNRLLYMGEAHYQLLSFLNLSGRLWQIVRMQADNGTSGGLLLLAARAGITDTVSFTSRLGVQHRSWRVSARSWLPVVYGSDFSETDLAIRFDLAIQWTSDWSSDIWLGTFDDLEVFNLHNPFLQISLYRKALWENVDAFAFGRYQILLGFGLVDNWTTGMGVRF